MWLLSCVTRRVASTVEQVRTGAAVVLVADDDVHIRTLIDRLLTREGFVVVEVPDGARAIECLSSRPFDLIVLDLMMPRVDGFGVISHLQKSRPELLARTVVVSAVPRTESLVALESVCAVVSKPFDTNVLVAALRKCLGR
jgi:DNA-binding response OmpR family regulator